MASTRRTLQVAENLKKLLSEIVEFKLHNPEKGLITISRVRISPDLKIARVYYSVLGDDQQKQKTADVLSNSKGFIKAELGKVITMRFTPDLKFFYDDSIDYSERINSIIDKIHDASGDNEKNES